MYRGQKTQSFFSTKIYSCKSQERRLLLTLNISSKSFCVDPNLRPYSKLRVLVLLIRLQGKQIWEDGMGEDRTGQDGIGWDGNFCKDAQVWCYLTETAISCSCHLVDCTLTNQADFFLCPMLVFKHRTNGKHCQLSLLFHLLCHRVSTP